MCGICGFVGAQRGMFAFVIWDEGKKELFAARDFFGIKPLHYAMIGGNFVFASEIKSILRFPGCGKRLNEEALEQYLSFQYSVLEETFLRGFTDCSREVSCAGGWGRTRRRSGVILNRPWRPRGKKARRSGRRL